MTFPKRLIDGYTNFLRARLPVEQGRYRELAEAGQSPEIMVIGCCDSRVSPEVIFDAKPGELFVVRNVANLVPPYTPDRRAARDVGGAGIRGAGAAGEAHRGAGARAVRRHPRLRGGSRAAVARRLHRQLDGDDCAGRPIGRPARHSAARRLFDGT